MDFIDQWVKHSMGTQGRDNLEKTDKVWLEVYKEIKVENPELRVEKGTLLYRVHTGGIPEPIFEDYKDYGEKQNIVFNERYNLWKNQYDIESILWDNHWVSFTDSLEVVASSYFEGKELRGLVIILKSNMAVAVYPYKNWGFDEREIVAPMDKLNLVEILPFKEFIKKYGTGNSD